jgi:hypothetical protein
MANCDGTNVPGKRQPAQPRRDPPHRQLPPTAFLLNAVRLSAAVSPRPTSQQPLLELVDLHHHPLLVHLHTAYAMGFRTQSAF